MLNLCTMPRLEIQRELPGGPSLRSASRQEGGQPRGGPGGILLLGHRPRSQRLEHRDGLVPRRQPTSARPRRPHRCCRRPPHSSRSGRGRNPLPPTSTDPNPVSQFWHCPASRLPAASPTCASSRGAVSADPDSGTPSHAATRGAAWQVVK